MATAPSSRVPISEASSSGARPPQDGRSASRESDHGEDVVINPPNVREHESDSRRLQDLRDWVRRTQKQREIEFLESVQQRYLAGDQAVIDMLSSDDAAIRLGVTSSSKPNLPRPEPPHVFKKKNRRDYNMWVRDCEAFHVQASMEFQREDQKVAFGIQYLSETLKTLWDTYCVGEVSRDKFWRPTWVILKKKMLDSLGTPAERCQAAYDTLKNYKQRPNQTPTEVLAQLRPLWEELEDQNPQRQTYEYISALMESVKRDLFLLSSDQRSSVPQVEEQANMIYRRLPQSQKEPLKDKDKDKGKGRTRDRSPASSSGEEKRSSKRARRKKNKDKDDKANSRKDKSKDKNRKPLSDVTCFKCWEKGHLAPKCPNPRREKPPEKTPEKSEKGEGQRN